MTGFARSEALALAAGEDMGPLLEAAAALRDSGHGDVVTYSRKVFIPLTRLCRNACRYCTFAEPPRKREPAFLSPEQVLAIAAAGAAAGCKEALFTLGDKPERRYREARDELARLGHSTTVSYLGEVAERVLAETGLLPHLNPGVLGEQDIATLRRVSVSQGLMLESASQRLCAKGGPHHGSPDKRPAARLEVIRLAGEMAVPFTTGILIGIGESRAERIEALLRLCELNDRYRHIQEIIVQNFRAKPGTAMAGASEPSLAEHLWTVALARLLFGPAMSIQAPPNLRPGALGALIGAGIDDWGGVSPVTPDHVNPEAPWPHLEALQGETAAAGKTLVERLAVYPGFVFAEGWIAPELRSRVLGKADSCGYARTDSWLSGGRGKPPPWRAPNGAPAIGGELSRLLAKAAAGHDLEESEIVSLFEARGPDLGRVCRAADDLRREVNGDRVTYVVNRNINYTNVCYYRCGFCAFAKGKLADHLRGRPYDLEIGEILRRVGEAKERGATEVCMQGGIHPAYTGDTYLGICRSVSRAFPDIHIHAFSPLEVWQGARTLGIGVAEFLGQLREAGLGSLPGTAAEILDDDVRAVICPDKISTGQWIDIVAAAHQAGLPTTSTIMFGHIDRPWHWARHLLHLRALQKRGGGITEFVPLPFVHMETPLYLKGLVRKGPTFREAVLMHAVARLALHPHITNIQTSWTKLGPDVAGVCLRSGANDLGGTLMNESISRAAGSSHGQEMPPERMEALIRSLSRTPRQRTTLYQGAPETSVSASFDAPALAPALNAIPPPGELPGGAGRPGYRPP